MKKSTAIGYYPALVLLGCAGDIQVDTIEASASHPGSLWLHWIILTLFIAAALALIAKARKKVMLPDTSHNLTTPAYVLIIGIIDFVFFTGFAILSTTILANETTTIWTTLAFILFSLLGLFLIYVSLIEKHSFDDEKITYTKFSGKSIQVSWDDITNIKYAATMQWFVFTDTKGQKCHISAMLIGIRPFCEKVILKVARSKIDADSFTILEKLYPK